MVSRKRRSSEVPEEPIELHQKQLATFYRLAEQSPLGNTTHDGRVTLGLGYGGVEYRPVEDTKNVLDFAHSHGYQITFHDCHPQGMSSMKFLRENNLLSDTMVLSHFNYPSEEDWASPPRPSPRRRCRVAGLKPFPP